MLTSPFAIYRDSLKKGFLARRHQLFINNKWQDAVDGGTIDVFDPSTSEKLGVVAAGTAKDIELAVQAAERAFKGPWSQLSGAARTRLMLRLADLIEQNADELATLETLNDGNPVTHVRHGDIALSLDYLRYYAGWTDKIGGEVPITGSRMDSLAFSIRQPMGVVGAIIPWNAPIILAMFKIGPALAAGCTMVLKPAELAPLTMLRLAELVRDAGIPEGVFNVVTGYGPEAGHALAAHPRVRKIAFTGSTATGRSILMAAAPYYKRVTLELGGKSPVLIFADADIDAATKAIANGIFYKTGQFCAAGTRLYVHDKVYDRVVAGFESLAKAAKVGQPLETDTQMGPIISQKQLDRVVGYVEQGTQAGVQVVTGGKTIPGKGYFFQPTLLANAKQDATIMQEEIFGPVLCANRFTDAEDLDTLASWANDTQYGLAARIWTKDLRTAHRLARSIDAGTISVNGGPLGDLPFGGFKNSGLGVELGRLGIEAYLEHKSIGINF